MCGEREQLFLVLLSQLLEVADVLADVPVLLEVLEEVVGYLLKLVGLHLADRYIVVFDFFLAAHYFGFELALLQPRFLQLVLKLLTLLLVYQKLLHAHLSVVW